MPIEGVALTLYFGATRTMGIGAIRAALSAMQTDRNDHCAGGSRITPSNRSLSEQGIDLLFDVRAVSDIPWLAPACGCWIRGTAQTVAGLEMTLR